MITNKQVFEEGRLVQHYPIDQNPHTGEQESNGGVENLVVYNQKVYSVLTDFTGSIANASGEPSLITDDADGFMKTMFFIDESDLEEALDAEVEAQTEVDYDEWERWESAHGIQEDFTSGDEW